MEQIIIEQIKSDIIEEQIIKVLMVEPSIVMEQIIEESKIPFALSKHIK